MAKRYSIRYTIDDSQPRASHKAAMSAAKALEAQYLRAAKAAEAVVAASARAPQGATTGGAAAAANGHARAAQAAVSGARSAANGQAAAAQAAVRAQAQTTAAAVQGAEARARAAEREADRVERAAARQARGAEAVARRKAAVGFVTQAPEGPGLKTVMADLDKLHASLAKDKSYYVAPGGAGAKPGAYQNVSTFLDKAKKERTAVDQPKVGVSGGEAFVDDGRHRLARLKELGVRHFPVSVPEESAAEFQAKFGVKSGAAPFPMTRSTPEREEIARELRARRAAEATEEQRIRAAQAELRAARTAQTQKAMVPPRPPGAGVGTAAAGGAEGKEPTVDVGLHKLQIDALKLTEKRAADARKLAEKEAADYDAIQARKARADDRAADRKARAAEKAAERAGKTAEKEAADHDRRAAAQQARDDRAADLKVARAQQAAEREAKAAQKKAADVSAVETKFAARDYQARVALEAKKEQQAERDAAAAVKRAERQARQEESNALGPYGRVAKIKRAALSEEQLQQAANAKQADATHNRRINQILRERGVGQDNFRSSIADALGLEAAFTKAGVALAAIGAGKMAFQVVTAAMAEARQASEAMARQVLDTAASLREIALLRGKFAPTEAEVERHMAVRKASGLTHEEAVGFETEILNQLGTISEQKFPEAERKKLSTEGARMAARGGGGISAITNRAKLIGMLPDFVKAGAGGQVQSQDVMAMADAVDKINAMSRASNATSAAQSAELISALTTEDMKGTFHDPRKAVALSTIAAKFEPESSANAALQAIRQGRGFTKFRKMRGTEAAQAETLKLAGIKEQMDPAETLTKLFEFAQKTMKPDEAFDAFLARRGFRDQTGNIKLAQFFNEFRKGNFQRIMAEAEKPLDVTAPGRKFAAFAVSDVGRDLMGKAAIDAAKMERGKLSTELELRTQEVTPAFVAAGGIDTTPAIIAATVVGRGDAERGRKAMLQREAVRNARQAAGVAPGLGLGTIGGLGMAATTAALAPFLGPAAPQVGLYGGAAAGYYSGENAEIVRELKRIADSNELMLKQDQQKKAQAKPQPLPPPQPLRGRADVPARH